MHQRLTDTLPPLPLPPLVLHSFSYLAPYLQNHQLSPKPESIHHPLSRGGPGSTPSPSPWLWALPSSDISVNPHRLCRVSVFRSRLDVSCPSHAIGV